MKAFKILFMIQTLAALMASTSFASPAAKTISCYTKFFGVPAGSTLSLVLEVSPTLKFETQEVKINGKKMQVDQKNDEGTFVTGKSKYAGMLRFPVGIVQAMDGYSMTLTIPNQAGKSNGFVTLKDGHGGSNYNLLCEIQ